MQIKHRFSAQNFNTKIPKKFAVDLLTKVKER